LAEFSIRENDHLEKLFIGVLPLRAEAGGMGPQPSVHLRGRCQMAIGKGDYRRETTSGRTGTYKKFIRAGSAALPASSARTNGRGVLKHFYTISHNKYEVKKVQPPQRIFFAHPTSRHDHIHIPARYRGNTDCIKDGRQK
jgi:hypothetical protein